MKLKNISLNRQTLLVGSLYLLLTLCAAQKVFSQEQESIRFIVIPIDGKSKYSSEVTNGLESVIGKITRFTLVDRANFDRIISEQKFHLSGMVSDRDMVNLGEMAGANKALAGNYTLSFDRIRTTSGSYTEADLQFNVKIIDIETGKVDIVLSEISGSGADGNNNRSKAFNAALSNALVRFDHTIREFYSLHFTIYRREGDTIIIKNGSESGIQPGQYYSVIDKKTVMDTETGEEFILDQEQKGIIKIVRITEGTSYAEIIEGTRQIEEGMILEENPTYFEKGSGITAAYSTYKDSSGFVPGFSISGKTNVGEHFNLGLGMGMTFGKYVSTFDLFGILGFRVPIVPEIVSFTVDGRIGYLFAWQEGRNIQDYIEEQGYDVKSANPRGGAVELGLFGGIEIDIPKDFLLVFNAGYLFIPAVTKWTLTEDRDKNPKSWSVPDEYLQPETFNASHIYFNIGIYYNGFKALL